MLAPMYLGCLRCARHVRDTDAICPFCGARMLPSAPRPRHDAPRLSRAALLLAGAAAVSACGKTTDTGSTSSSGTSVDRVPAPAYGGPPPAFVDAGATTATPAPVPPPDASPTADAGAPRDSGASRDR